MPFAKSFMKSLQSTVLLTCHILLVVLTNSTVSLQPQQQTNNDISEQQSNLNNRRQFYEPTSVQVSGMFKLCIDFEPNGAAIVEAANGDKVVIIFKADVFWTLGLNAFIESIEGNSLSIKQQQQQNDNSIKQRNLPASLTMSDKNVFKVSDWWPQLDVLVEQALGFADLPKTDSFYNNIFVFYQYRLIRYRVETISLNEHADKVIDLSIKHLGMFKSQLWISLHHFKDIQYMTTIPKTRSILVKSIGASEASLYLVNELNIDNPVQYLQIEESISNVSLSQNAYSVVLLTDKSTITISKKIGQICSDYKCKPLHSLIVCDPKVNAFIGTYVFWLWRDTSLTMRLVGIASCSIMFVNFILGVSFIGHQLQQSSELT